MKTHQLSKTRIYHIWGNMINRCHNPKNLNYFRYGAQGIKVCKRWRKFENFYADMSATYKDGLTIDRIDNTKEYSPENCRWATPKTQARNRRSNVYLTYRGKTQLISDWADELGIKRSTLSMRLKYKWSVEKALSKGVSLSTTNR